MISTPIKSIVDVSYEESVHKAVFYNVLRYDFSSSVNGKINYKCIHIEDSF